jgi:cytochrome c oxidase subunit II
VKRLTFVSSVIAATLLLQPALPARAATPDIHISAKNWAFTPSTITLHLNKPVKLVFVATEGIHGITIPDLGVNNVVNVGSSPSEVVVTPSKLGTFIAHCAVFCGTGHANMILTIKVVK